MHKRRSKTLLSHSVQHNSTRMVTRRTNTFTLIYLHIHTCISVHVYICVHICVHNNIWWSKGPGTLSFAKNKCQYHCPVIHDGCQPNSLFPEQRHTNGTSQNNVVNVICLDTFVRLEKIWDIRWGDSESRNSLMQRYWNRIHFCSALGCTDYCCHTVHLLAWLRVLRVLIYHWQWRSSEETCVF